MENRNLVEMSEDVLLLMEAIQAISLEVGILQRTTLNEYFGKKYTALPDLLKKINPSIKKHGLLILQIPYAEGELITIIKHKESKQYVKSILTIMPKDQRNPQAIGSTISYSRRYALMTLLGLTSEDDDDGNSGANLPTVNLGGVKKPASLFEELAKCSSLEEYQELGKQVQEAFTAKKGELHTNLKTQHNNK